MPSPHAAEQRRHNTTAVSRRLPLARAAFIQLCEAVFQMGCGGTKAEVETNSNSPDRGLPPKAEAQVEAVVVEEIEEAAEAAKKAAEEAEEERLCEHEFVTSATL